MPYFQIARPVRVNHDAKENQTAVLQQDGTHVLQACVSENYKRRILLSVNVPNVSPIILGMSALDAAWLGTQLLELSAIADDIADETE